MSAPVLAPKTRPSFASVVLLSGGLDSTVALAWARARGPVVPVAFDYRQRHAIELEHAAKVAAHYNLPLLTLALPVLGVSPLTGHSEVPHRTDADRAQGIAPTYVPTRNTLMLAMALAVAETRGARDLVVGFNREDETGYPDCRPEFVQAFGDVARLGTREGCRVVAPLLGLDKAGIVRLGLTLGAPLHLTWSCYNAGPAPCGHCDACVLRARGFAGARVSDPAGAR